MTRTIWWCLLVGFLFSKGYDKDTDVDGSKPWIAFFFHHLRPDSPPLTLEKLFFVLMLKILCDDGAKAGKEPLRNCGRLKLDSRAAKYLSYCEKQKSLPSAADIKIGLGGPKTEECGVITVLDAGVDDALSCKWLQVVGNMVLPVLRFSSIEAGIPNPFALEINSSSSWFSETPEGNPNTSVLYFLSSSSVRPGARPVIGDSVNIIGSMVNAYIYKKHTHLYNKQKKNSERI